MDSFARFIGSSFMEFDLKLSRLKSGLGMNTILLAPMAIFHGIVIILPLLSCVIINCLKPLPMAQKGSKREEAETNISTSDTAATLNILTFNIRCGINRKSSYDINRCVDSITKSKYDVVFLQEVTDGGYGSGWIGTTKISGAIPAPIDQLATIESLLKSSQVTKHYAKCTSTYLGPYDLAEVGRSGTYGIGVITTHPVIATKTLAYKRFGTRQRRGAIALLLQVTEKHKTWVVNTHFQHDATGLEQEQQAVELLGWLDDIKKESGCANVVMGGDLNSPPRFSGIRLLEQSLGPGRAPEVTFPMPVIGGVSIDYLFAAGPSILRILPNTVLNEDEASDHFPMKTAVQLF
jgi:endonuclease/exonuclease/phosphatase family metal-dependent hydrolase